ncbi:uncharacterized protein B0I36DRAFT_332062 [Microdochium trichocladiopsis]|uniref:F-box domain-containing protein n=1 Tax=Microdochium trichocladiopsis TaxID=1682393 RepID=A0A9P8XXU7_9PEZI|nr:uncharacterized protein B0I36DRAFT_332062 [Microdochium trichocladiopsis]KAH7024811.1 hypothetical protein B0I36DRAFT_332062 [Microdochium trichocladiopsis]
MPDARHLPDEIFVNIFENFAIPAEALSTTFGDRHWAENGARRATLARACQASHRLRRVAEPILYRRLVHGSHNLLAVFCSRPALGEHVRHILYDGWTLEKSRDMMRVYSPTVRKIARDKYQSRALDRLLERTWDCSGNHEDARLDKPCDYFASQGYTMLLPLILVLTPNLETLTLLQRDLDQSDTLSRLFNFCGRRLECSGGLSDFGDGQTQIQALPLSKLRALATVGGSTRWPKEVDSTEDQAIVSLIFFPGLKSFSSSALDWAPISSVQRLNEARTDDAFMMDLTDPRAQHYHEHDYEDIDNPDDKGNALFPPAHGSHPNLEHLALVKSSGSSAADLREVLLVFPSLQSLVLHFVVFRDREKLDFAQYGNTLRDPATDAAHLRRFELEPALYEARLFGSGLDPEMADISEKEDQGIIGSLRDAMPSLEQLRVPLAALVGIGASPGAELDLCAVLPASLRWFWTAVTVAGDAGAHLDALERMLDEAEHRLPALEWVLVRLPVNHEILCFECSDFVATRVGDQHVLYQKRTVAVGTPPGWEHEEVEHVVFLP